jgi:anti-sigma factor RsiW
MKCQDVLKKISAYMDGESDVMMSQRIREHLSGCAECRKALRAFQDMDSFLRKLPTCEVSSGFTRQVTAELRFDRRSKPAFAPNLLNHFLKFFETFFDLLESPKSPASLEEFADFPTCSLCKIYFKIL